MAGAFRAIVPLSLVTLFAARAAADQIIAPHAAGATSGFFPLENAFDGQPLLDPTSQTPAGGGGANALGSYTSTRSGYIDFGPDWQHVRITSTWTLYRDYTSGDQEPFDELWWDEDFDAINDSGHTESRFNFNTARGVTNRNTEQWIRDNDLSVTPVAPLARYLMVRAKGTQTPRRAKEFAFIGYRYQPNYQIITPAGAGKLAGGLYFPLEFAFDGQPSLPAGAGDPAGGSGGADAPAYPNRYGYIDFGPDYAKVRITETWTQYRAWSEGAQSGFVESWWDEDPHDNVNEGIPETTLKFNSAPAVPRQSTEQWLRDAAVSERDAIIPRARYLVLKSDPAHTNRAKEFAMVGWINDVAAASDQSGPVHPVLGLPEPPLFDYGALTLVDEIRPGTDDEAAHAFTEAAAGESIVETLLGKRCRTIPNVGDNPKYFAYKLGAGRGLVPGKGYVLAIDYPDDRSRSMVVVNHGAETNRGFHTGTTVGDALLPPYVSSNGESLHYGFSRSVRSWQEVFYLHDRFPATLKKARDGSGRTMTPDQGFWVAVAQFQAKDDPTNRGAAVCRVALYEAPELAAMTQPLNPPPAGLPRRHLFWREEMSDGVVSAKDPNARGVTDDIAWYEYKAKLHKVLGMDTFSKDLLEFGHNQGFDSAKYPNLYVQPDMPFRWEGILAMLSQGGYDLNILPYYEYAGATGKRTHKDPITGNTLVDLGLGLQKRSLPLNGERGVREWFTQITWSEKFNVDVTDRDTLKDTVALLEVTLADVALGNRPLSRAVAQGAHNSTWTAGQRGYIDFGPNWQDIRISETWTRSRRYHAGQPSPYAAAWWAGSLAGFTASAVPSTAIAEARLNFITQPQSGETDHWTRDVWGASEAGDEAVTPQGRYLILQAAATLTPAHEFAMIGSIGGSPRQVITPHGAGKVSGNHDLSAMFDDQPVLGEPLNVLGAWLRPRVSAVPVSFDDATLERYSPSITREELRASREKLLNPKKAGDAAPITAYYDWWLRKRHDWLVDVRDYLRDKVNPDAAVLYTADVTECGKPHPKAQPDVVTDDLVTWEGPEYEPWGDEPPKHDALALEDALAERLGHQALTRWTLPYSGYEWDHSVPPPDPQNYRNTFGVMMTQSFNRVYTTSDPATWEAFTTPDGSAAIRHYCLNEDVMSDPRISDPVEKQLLGYFVTDMELAGPYSMMPEARALAFGNPRYIGYLSSNSFNRGFPQYARAFNAHYLALPALPAVTVPGAASDPEVVVRRIDTPQGTWLAIINIGFGDKRGVTVTLPTPGGVVDAVTGAPLAVSEGKLKLDMYPAQLTALRASGN